MAQEAFNRNFRVVPNEARIPLDKKDQVMAEVAKLEGLLKELFPVPCRYGKCEMGEYSGLTIIDRLVDTDETRIGPPPKAPRKIN